MNIDALKRTVNAMKHSPVDNYAGIPGLTSWLIGAGISPTHGGMRLFTCLRNHQEPIIPHSHRYDLHCIVLAGKVQNLIWSPTVSSSGDRFTLSNLNYCGKPGSYNISQSGSGYYSASSCNYTAGEEYLMDSKTIHSIFFSRGAEVLIIESAPKSDTSAILEPRIGDETIRTFQVQPWAFQQRKEDK